MTAASGSKLGQEALVVNLIKINGCAPPLLCASTCHWESRQEIVLQSLFGVTQNTPPPHPPPPPTFPTVCLRLNPEDRRFFVVEIFVISSVYEAKEYTPKLFYSQARSRTSHGTEVRKLGFEEIKLESFLTRWHVSIKRSRPRSRSRSRSRSRFRFPVTVSRIHSCNSALHVEP